MRVPKENFIKGAILHIYNHAIDNQLLCRDDQDYSQILRRMLKNLNTIPASIFSYCLMPNHYHFLIRQDGEKPLFQLFNNIFSGYVQYYNKKYTRKGRLFQSPLQHISVNYDQYLIKLSIYIHYNPVKAGLVAKPEDWIYSNYREWIGRRKSLLFSNELKQTFDISSEDYIQMMKDYESNKFENAENDF